MKKLLLILTFTLSMFAASCPDLSIKTESIDSSNEIKDSFNDVSEELFLLYKDILIQYNDLDDNVSYINYVRKDTLAELAATHIWGTLMALRYMEFDEKGPIYFYFIESINKNNLDWCNLESYKPLLKEVIVTKESSLDQF